MKKKMMILSKLAPIETNQLKLKPINRHQLTNSYELLVKIEACGVCRSQLH
ncbi:MAG: hypothetical protein OXF77_00375 [Thaumarchaeota archaeon]|nr:hypothetical protein [Nitrososphaerota archaeon]